MYLHNLKMAKINNKINFGACMKNKILTLTVLILLNSLLGHAQLIKGKVVSAIGVALPSCSVSITDKATAKIISLNITNQSGDFLFENIANGTYQIGITSIGFVSYTTATFKVNNDTTTIPNITLLPNKNANLATVVVTATRPLVEVKADKMQINVEGTINAVGSDALELIRKAPGVAVDKDDNIQMSGKAGVQIYIDGKPSPLIGEDLANYLKTIQSAQIDALELITNPSAKYEAAGNAGIINIKLKKNKSLGTNGSLQAGYAVGIRSKYNGGFNINNRTQKFNLFANYNYSYIDNVIDFRTNRKLADTTFDLRAKRIFLNKTSGFKAGLDFFQDRNSTWGVLITGNLTNSSPNGVSNNIITANNTGNIFRILESNTRQIGNDDNVNFNTNYKFANAKNIVFNVDADYGIIKLNRNLFQPNTYFNATKTQVLSEVNYNLLSLADISILAIKADYEQPLAKGTLGVGAKFSYVISDNNFKRYNVFSNTQKTLDVSKSNQFDYRENINAIYINYNKNWKKIQLQAGLRGEQTEASGTSYAITASEAVNLNSGQKFVRRYVNLFPTVGISFTGNAKSIWNVAVGRRVDRPNYQDLNPFEFKIDEYSARAGNVGLIPQFSYNAGITNSYKNKLISKITYSKITNLIGRLIDTTDGSKSIFKPRNLALQNLVSLFESYQLTYKKYTGIYTANLFYTNYQADFGGGSRVINNSATALIVTAQNSIKLIKDYTVELNANYNSPTVNGTAFEKVRWGIDVGAQKVVLNGQGTIRLSATDIFWTNYDRSYLVFGAQTVDGIFKRESRQYKLNFSYRFGSKQIKASRNRSSATEDELKRTQGGG